MENQIVIGMFGIILGYFAFRYYQNRKKNTFDFSDILNEDKYKVKGKFEK